MKRAYYVLGPESSGTRFVTRLLIGAGCVGDADHAQRWDSQSFGDTDPVVWRRSVPHNRAWPSLREMLDKAQGRQVQVVICVRDWEPTARSQVKTGHVPGYAEAMRNIQRATLDVFRQVGETGVPYTTAVYESLVTHPLHAIPTLLRRLGLDDRFTPITVDGNAKWWKAQKERAA